MPFLFPMQPFTKTEVARLHPDQKGVYGIFRGSLCVYVGSGDIRQRLLDHLNGDNPCIARKQPDSWTAIVTADYLDNEKKLTLEYNPVCNKRVG